VNALVKEVGLFGSASLLLSTGFRKVYRKVGQYKKVKASPMRPVTHLTQTIKKMNPYPTMKISVLYPGRKWRSVIRPPLY